MDNSSTESNNLILYVLCICSLLVRIWGIWGYAFNPDEMQFLIIAKGASLGEVWQRGLAELHPPLVHFIHHYLLMISSDFFVQRLFSVAGGVLSVFGMYRLGLLLKDEWLGLFLAFCIAFSPVAISTSMTYRNYSFFMPLLIFSLCAFIRYQRQHKFVDLFTFTSLIFLACATHFTGFLVAAACGLSEGLLLLRHHKIKPLLIWCASFIPLILLATFFYLHFFVPGAAGPSWQAFTYATGAVPKNFIENATLALKLAFAYFFPFIGFVNWAWVNTQSFILILIISCGAGLIVLYMFGLHVLRQKNPSLALLIFIQWLITLCAALSGYIFLAPTRHNIYFLPFFLIPYGYLLEPLLRKWLWPNHSSIVAIMTLAILLAASNCYTLYSDEFTLTKYNLDDAQSYLNSHLQAGDLIVSRSGYFYLLYAEDQGKTPYADYGRVSYKDGTQMISFDSPLKAYNENALHDVLLPYAGDAGNIWFVQYGWKTAQLWQLMQCPEFHAHINNFFSRDGALVFSIRAEAFHDLLHDNTAWQKCFADYKPHITGETFPAITYDK